MTVHPDHARGTEPCTTEVDVDPGTTVGALRPHLARLTGWAGWSSAAVRLAVDDAVLDETHPVGHHPLVPGAVLRPGPGRPPVERLAVQARRHVAVVAGPDCGALVAVPERGTLTLHAGDGPHAVADPDLGVIEVRARGRRVHVRVGHTSAPARLDRSAAPPGSPPARPGPRGGRDGGVPSDHPRSRTTTGRRARRSRRVRPGRWISWRPRDVLLVGRTALALRPAPSSTVDDRPGVDRADGGRGGTEQAMAWLAPLAGSVALALVLRQPALLLVGVVVPLVGLGAHVVRRRRRGRDLPTEAGHATVERAPLDPADLTCATTAATLGAALHVRGGVPWSADGCLAVVGTAADAVATARAVVLAELGSHARRDLAVLARTAGDWRWAAPAEPRTVLPSPGDPDTVVVCDDPGDVGRLAAWRSTAPARHRVLLVLGRHADVPAWCRTVVEVGPAGARLHVAGAAPATVPWHAVTAARAHAQLVRARTLRDLDAPEPPVPAVPAVVALGDLPGVPVAAADAVAAAWSTPRCGLPVPLGRGAGGRDVTVDLVAAGPHALVAGTTGAGKSELLTTLVLALALLHPPERLALLLVDFKGGTGLGALADLPHVVDHVTDLDAARTQRVLVALRAETRRRERLVASHGVHDLADLDADDPTTPPRLVVVVDELRALADDVPDAVPTLARLAAQGRSLGIHLVLATQRPAGVVTADLRANVELRVALRVTDDADSRDVVDDPQAARLDPRTPGRAVLRRGSSATEVVQVARPRAAAGAPPARLAAAGLDGAVAGWVPRPPDGPPRPDDVRAWVEAATTAARARPRRGVPWIPALPGRVLVDDVPDGRGLALALADLPDEQRRAPVRWAPADGHLLVLGGPASGRTTTLVTLGTQALAAGTPVHAVGLPATAVDQLRRADVHGRFGTAVAVHEVRRLARLLELLTASASPALLLVDGLTHALDRLATIARGAGADRLAACWRGDGPVAVAATCDVTTAALHHAGAFRDRLVLPVADASLDALAGVPTSLAGPRPAGRGVHLRDGGGTLCQVAVVPEAAAPADGSAAAPGTGPVAGATTGPADAPATGPVAGATAGPAASPATGPADAPATGLVDAAGRAADGGPTPDPSVVRVLPLPLLAPLPGHLAPGRAPDSPEHGADVPGRPVASTAEPVEPATAPARGGEDGGGVRVPIGPGGDDAREVCVDTARALLVAGPPGSGRSTALAVVAAGLRASGATVVRLVDRAAGPSTVAAGTPGVDGILDVPPDAVPDDAVVLVDDLDEVERTSPALADAVERLARTPGGPSVVAATTAHAAGAFRGPHAALVRARQVLVLDAHDPAAAELVGPAAPWLVDPRERPAGRGVLVVDRRAVPVQVYDPGDERSVGR